MSIIQIKKDLEKARRETLLEEPCYKCGKPMKYHSLSVWHKECRIHRRYK